MPPKKRDQPSTKSLNKEKNKLVEDKTFGLKNKSKSKKVQQFVQNVEKAMQQKVFKNKQQKLEEKQRQAELEAIFNVTKKAGETLGTYRYEEDEDEEEYPDEQYFSKFYLEQNPDALEEWIDKQRDRIEKITPVTLESFMAWKEKKLAEKEEQERKRKRAAEEAYRRSGGGISGRALFDVDASIFIDDEEGVEEYEFEDLEGIDESLFDDFDDIDLDDSGDASTSSSASISQSFYPENYTPQTWSLNKTPKMLLQEWCQRSGNAPPVYTRVLNEPGNFLSSATLPLCEGHEFKPEQSSPSAKEAEHNTALQIIRHLEMIGEF